MLTIQEVAAQYYELAQQGQLTKIHEELYAPDALSIEPENVSLLPLEVTGIPAIREKEEILNQQVEAWHGGYCGKPEVSAHFFACRMGMDVTLKGRGRHYKEQIGVFQVTDGKIVKEQFFYNDAAY